MKIKIMMMLAAVLMIGMAGGQSYQGATTFDGNITMDGNAIIDAKLGQSNFYVTVGSYDWCDYQTDGTDDQIEVNTALAAHDVVYIVSPIYITSELVMTRLGGELHGVAGGNRGWPINSVTVEVDGIDAIVCLGSQNTIRNIAIEKNQSIANTGGSGINISSVFVTLDHVFITRTYDGISINENGSLSNILNTWILSCPNIAIKVDGAGGTILDNVRAEGYQNENATQGYAGLYVVNMGSVHATKIEILRYGHNFYFQDVPEIYITSSLFDQGNKSNMIISSEDRFCANVYITNSWIAGRTVDEGLVDVPLIHLRSENNGRIVNVGIHDSALRDGYAEAIQTTIWGGGIIDQLTISGNHFLNFGLGRTAALIVATNNTNHVTITNNRYLLEPGRTHAAVFIATWMDADNVCSNWIYTNNDFSACTNGLSFYPDNSITSPNIMPEGII